MSISVGDTTANQGAGPAAASSTGFYLSTNSVFDTADRFLGSRSVADLAGGATSAVTTMVQIPGDVAAGTYYVFAIADWSGIVGETAETNNSRSGTLPVGGDLQVTSLTIAGGGVASGPLTVTDSTKNQGASISQSETGFYFSINSTLDASDVFLGSRVVPALGPAAISTASTPLTVPAGTSPGTYWVIAVADWGTAIAESSETNNTRANSFKVGPDLIVSALMAPTSAIAGATISVTDTTWNQGGDTAPASGTAYYLSSNGTLDASDTLLGTRTIPSLVPGSSQAGTVSVAIPASTAAGTYVIFAKSDGNDSIAETIETNNTRTRSISVTAGSP